MPQAYGVPADGGVRRVWDDAAELLVDTAGGGDSREFINSHPSTTNFVDVAPLPQSSDDVIRVTQAEAFGDIKIRFL